MSNRRNNVTISRERNSEFYEVTINGRTNYYKDISFLWKTSSKYKCICENKVWVEIANTIKIKWKAATRYFTKKGNTFFCYGYLKRERKSEASLIYKDIENLCKFLGVTWGQLLPTEAANGVRLLKKSFRLPIGRGDWRQQGERSCYSNRYYDTKKKILPSAYVTNLDLNKAFVTVLLENPDLPWDKPKKFFYNPPQNCDIFYAYIATPKEYPTVQPFLPMHIEKYDRSKDQKYYDTIWPETEIWRGIYPANYLEYAESIGYKVERKWGVRWMKRKDLSDWTKELFQKDKTLANEHIHALLGRFKPRWKSKHHICLAQVTSLVRATVDIRVYEMMRKVNPLKVIVDGIYFDNSCPDIYGDDYWRIEAQGTHFNKNDHKPWKTKNEL